MNRQRLLDMRAKLMAAADLPYFEKLQVIRAGLRVVVEELVTDADGQQTGGA